MDWTTRNTCLVGMLCAAVAAVPAAAQTSNPAAVPPSAPAASFDCPMPVMGMRSDRFGLRGGDPPPEGPIPAPGDIPEAPMRAVPMPTVDARCFNPLATNFAPPVRDVRHPRVTPGFPLFPGGDDTRIRAQREPDRFGLDGSMGVTPPRRQ